MAERKRPQVLLLGNGLNQCLNHGVSWGDLLEKIAVEYETSYYKDISMPLEFERIVNEHLKKHGIQKQDIYTEIKKKVIQQLKKQVLPADAVHRRIADLNLDAIITTNYDPLLEQVFVEASAPLPVPSSTKYLQTSTAEISGIKFYHAHGFYLKPQSLCLGYEHYAGILQRLREDINTVKDKKGKRIRQVLDGSLEPLGHWGELFYTADIAIIGFGLWESEIDFWWLITHRAYLYHTNYEGIRRDMNNTIVYYDIIDDVERSKEEDEASRMIKANQQKNKHRLLEGSHIVVKSFSLKECGTHERAYHMIFDDLVSSNSHKEEEIAYV